MCIRDRHNKEIINDSFKLCDYILDTAKVVTVPGDGFGAPGHIRFSYAVSKDTIRNGIDRVVNALNELNWGVFMKKEIHPDYHPVVFVDSATGDEILTKSTITSDEKRDIDGVSH